MGKKRMCYLQQKELVVMVASWACEVTETFIQRSTEEAYFL